MRDIFNNNNDADRDHDYLNDLTFSMVINYACVKA